MTPPESADPKVLFRQTQLGTITGALGIDGFALQPLLEVCARDLVGELVLGVPFGFGSLSACTRVAGADAGARLLALLGEVYQVPAPVLEQARALHADLGARGVTVTVEEAKGAAEPSLAFAYDGPWTLADIATRLPALGIGAAARAAVEQRAAALCPEGAVVERLAVTIDKPAAEPEVELTLSYQFLQAEAAARGALLDGVFAALAVSERQRMWAGKMFPTLAPREVNAVTATLTVGRDRLANQVRLRFPDIPSRLVLRLLGQFAPRDDNGKLLGTLEAAAGVKEEMVTALLCTVWDGEPPRLAVELRAAEFPARP